MFYSHQLMSYELLASPWPVITLNITLKVTFLIHLFHVVLFPAVYECVWRSCGVHCGHGTHTIRPLSVSRPGSRLWCGTHFTLPKTWTNWVLSWYCGEETKGRGGRCKQHTWSHDQHLLASWVTGSASLMGSLLWNLSILARCQSEHGERLNSDLNKMTCTWLIIHSLALLLLQLELLQQLLLCIMVVVILLFFVIKYINKQTNKHNKSRWKTWKVWSVHVGT